MAQFALKTALPNYLRDEQFRIEEFARNVGLDFFPTIFEVLSYDQMKQQLADGTPSIVTSRVYGTGDDGFLLSVFNLRDGEERIVADRVKRILARA